MGWAGERQVSAECCNLFIHTCGGACGAAWIRRKWAARCAGAVNKQQAVNSTSWVLPVHTLDLPTTCSQLCCPAGCPSAHTCTLVLRGGSEQFLDEADRSLHDGELLSTSCQKL